MWVCAHPSAVRCAKKYTVVIVWKEILSTFQTSRFSVWVVKPLAIGTGRHRFAESYRKRHDTKRDTESNEEDSDANIPCTSVHIHTGMGTWIYAHIRYVHAHLNTPAYKCTQTHIQICRSAVGNLKVTMRNTHRDPSMYTAYGPRGRYWNPASPVRLTGSQLDRSNFACARSAVTSLVPLERKETQPFFGTSLKKIGESAWVHELRKVFSAFWGKLFGLLGKTARNDPWAWRLV